SGHSWLGHFFFRGSVLLFTNYGTMCQSIFDYGHFVPFFYFMAGWHDEYHTPKDELKLVNYNKAARIARIGFLNVWAIANMDEL
ncbi:MAG: hypothetical protein ABFS05_13765, partial [Bacteroidota bacterium]